MTGQRSSKTGLFSDMFLCKMCDYGSTVQGEISQNNLCLKLVTDKALCRYTFTLQNILSRALLLKNQSEVAKPPLPSHFGEIFTRKNVFGRTKT